MSGARQQKYEYHFIIFLKTFQLHFLTSSLCMPLCAFSHVLTYSLSNTETSEKFFTNFKLQLPATGPVLNKADSLLIVKEPLGVVLVVCPWNGPLLSVLPAIGALAAGLFFSKRTF